MANMDQQLGLLERIGRTCARRPGRTIGMWLVVLIAALTGHHAISSVYQNNINLAGTQASTGFALLRHDDPKASGYTGLVVVTGSDLGSQSSA